jgi:hypothetical protein
MRKCVPGGALAAVIIVSVGLLPIQAVAASKSAVKVKARATKPAPQLKFIGSEHYTIKDRAFVRYKFDVTNKARYPAELFAPSPALPPCGLNASASRTWVDFYDAAGKRLYGFCALKAPQDLSEIWFAVDEGQSPPRRVYIEMLDRLTGTKLKSNLASTSSVIPKHKIR